MYDIIKASDLLKKIGIVVLESDEAKIKILNLDVTKYNDDFFIIKDSDGWRLQSHFMATDNTIYELESCVNNYIRRNDRKNLSELDIKECESEIRKIDILLV